MFFVYSNSFRFLAPAKVALSEFHKMGCFKLFRAFGYQCSWSFSGAKRLKTSLSKTGVDCKVVATNGDTHLGGEDFDQRGWGLHSRQLFGMKVI